MGSVREFYQDQTIFLTGATGFLGQLLVEKILRSTYNVKAIYLLVRQKRGKSENERLEEICGSECFKTLKTLHPDFIRKLHTINGDCSKPFLGMCDQDQALIQQEVTVIIHSAANVRFDTDLKTAIYTNVRAVRDLVTIAKKSKILKAFIHVSTAFSHCYMPEIDEEIYGVNVDPDKVIEAVEKLDDELLTSMVPALLGKWPNTYVYSKALAEWVVGREKDYLPVAIVRPSIVGSTYNEPLEGWINNFNGLAGMVAGCSLGVIKSFQVNANAHAQIVPADYVVNTIIAVGWDRANKEKVPEVPVYNAVVATESLQTWGSLIKCLLQFVFVYPTNRAIWYYSYYSTSSEWAHKIRVFFLHTLLGYLVDGILMVFGKSPFAVEKFAKINKLIDCLTYFSTGHWTFSSDNLQKLWEKLDADEKKIFYLDSKNLDWDDYLEKSIVGGRIYLLKDPLDTLPKARRKMYFLAVLHYLVVAFLGWQLLKVVFSVFNFLFLRV